MLIQIETGKGGARIQDSWLVQRELSLHELGVPSNPLVRESSSGPRKVRGSSLSPAVTNT